MLEKTPLPSYISRNPLLSPHFVYFIENAADFTLCKREYLPYKTYSAHCQLKICLQGVPNPWFTPILDDTVISHILGKLGKYLHSMLIQNKYVNVMHRSNLSHTNSLMTDCEIQNSNQLGQSFVQNTLAGEMFCYFLFFQQLISKIKYKISEKVLHPHPGTNILNEMHIFNLRCREALT